MDVGDSSGVKEFHEVVVGGDKVTKLDTGVMKLANETEENAEGCVVVENGNEILTIVTQENEEPLYIYEGNGENVVGTTNEFVEVCDSNSAFESSTNYSDGKIEVVAVSKEDESKEEPKENSTPVVAKHTEEEVNVVEEEEEEDIEIVNCQDLSDTVKESQSEEPDTCNIVTVEKATTNPEESSKNYKTVILEDWEVDTPHVPDNQDARNDLGAVVVIEEPQQVALEIVTEKEAEEVVASQDVTNGSHVDVDVKVTDTSGEDANDGVEPADASQQNDDHNSVNESNASGLQGEIMKLMTDTKVESLKYSKSISKDDIVKILDESTERVVKPIVTGKDLFFSIELTKRLNQKFLQNRALKNLEGTEKTNSTAETETATNNNNSLDERQKIVDILEADEIKDWKSVPVKSATNAAKENGDDMEISKAIKIMEAGNSGTEVATTTTTVMTTVTTITTTTTAGSKTPRKPGKKFRTDLDKELERTIALQQLREEFPTTRKRTRTTKKVKHIPFLASTVLEKAMTSPEVTTALKPGPPKRRPCYLPDNKSDANKSSVSTESESDAKKSKTLTESKSGAAADLSLDDASNSSVSNSVVKTYSGKRKSSDAEGNMKTTLETLEVFRKALNESANDSASEKEFKPKKQKTVSKSDEAQKGRGSMKERKSGGKAGPGGKRNLELEKLLGDEGAVRMLYETQHKDGGTHGSPRKSAKTTTGLKKDLVLKTKLVKNAVMRLSGLSSEGVHLRGKRYSKSAAVVKPDVVESEPLFASTPNIVLYKPKKKQRAEASRILYRHSSSESFDSSEGYNRRTSLDGDVSNGPGKESVTLNGDAAATHPAVDFSAAKPDKMTPKSKPGKSEVFAKRKFGRIQAAKRFTHRKRVGAAMAAKGRIVSEGSGPDSSLTTNSSKLDLSNVPVRKSSRPRTVSKKYSIWSSTSMDSLSVEALGLKKLKKASPELGKKLNCKELTILQYESLVQVVLSPVSTLLKNSLNVQVLEELKHVFNFLAEEDSCRAVLISSMGATFCQGLDLNQIISCEEAERKNRICLLINAIGELCSSLSNFNKPVMAGVQGGAVGLGVTLLPYCDLVIASDKASFYTPYVKLGQAPEGAPTYTFPRISAHLVSELLFQSRKMTAADAFKYGLVTKIIPEDRFEEDLILFARNMASQPVQGLQSIKCLLGARDRSGRLEETLEMESEMLEEQWTTTECLNNMIKFLNSGELQLKDHT